MPGYRRRPTPRSHQKRVPLYGRCNHRPILGKSRSSISRRRGSPVGLFGPRCVHYISQITPKFKEIVPPFHRQENCIPSAGLRQPDLVVWPCSEAHSAQFLIIQTHPSQDWTCTLGMSAYGYKRTFYHTLIYVCFAPESGHPARYEKCNFGRAPECPLSG